MKICNKCNVEKDESEFLCYGPKNTCKLCHSETRKKHYTKNKEKILNRVKLYKQSNKENIKIKNKLYREKNKECLKYKDKQKYLKIKNNPQDYKLLINNISKNNKKRRLENINYKLKCTVSRSINRIINKNNQSCLKFFPYSILELKMHLESLFEPWMTWENHGVYNLNTWKDDDQSTWTWHIDHIIPQSKFQYTSMEDQAFKDCWALSNLRPYSAKQNVIDGDRR